MYRHIREYNTALHLHDPYTDEKRGLRYLVCQVTFTTYRCVQAYAYIACTIKV